MEANKHIASRGIQIIDVILGDQIRMRSWDIHFLNPQRKKLARQLSKSSNIQHILKLSKVRKSMGLVVGQTTLLRGVVRQQMYMAGG